jgi:hypothetical protein
MRGVADGDVDAHNDSQSKDCLLQARVKPEELAGG